MENMQVSIITMENIVKNVNFLNGKLKKLIKETIRLLEKNDSQKVRYNYDIIVSYLTEIISKNEILYEQINEVIEAANNLKILDFKLINEKITVAVITYINTRKFSCLENKIDKKEASVLIMELDLLIKKKRIDVEKEFIRDSYSNYINTKDEIIKKYIKYAIEDVSNLIINKINDLVVIGIMEKKSKVRKIEALRKELHCIKKINDSF